MNESNFAVYAPADIECHRQLTIKWWVCKGDSKGPFDCSNK